VLILIQEMQRWQHDLSLGLIGAPSVRCECTDVEQVGACPPQQSETGHRSASASGTELAENAFEARVLRDSTLLAFDQRGADGFDFARPLVTTTAIEALDKLMRDARALIRFQRQRLFQNPRGVSHCGSLSRRRGWCQGPPVNGGCPRNRQATRTSIGTVKAVSTCSCAPAQLETMTRS
jgi:hypothetical protein